MSRKIIERFKPALEASRRPCVSLVPTERATLAPWASKIGGQPFLPAGHEVPRGRKRQPMHFVGQIRFDDAPALDPFPATGLLQFWVAADMLYGVNYDDLNDPRGFCVRYFPDAGPDSALAPPSAYVLPKNPERESPIPEGAQYGLRFTASTMAVQVGDVHVAKHLGRLSDEEYDALEEALFASKYTVRGHHYGGYPRSVQEDPRKWPAYRRKRLDTVLLHLGCDRAFTWAGVGAANFLISDANLRKRDFSKVYYHWSCG